MENSDTKSLLIARQFLGKEVKVVVDCSMGSKHPKFGFVYETNYGYVPDIKGPDGENLDVYYLGVNQPITKGIGMVIAIVHRLADDDDKLVVVPQGIELTSEDIEKQIAFQEKWFDHEILRAKE